MCYQKMGRSYLGGPVVAWVIWLGFSPIGGRELLGIPCRRLGFGLGLALCSPVLLGSLWTLFQEARRVLVASRSTPKGGGEEGGV